MEKPALYQAWFCPFAQRAWIGVLHRKLDIKVKEQDPYDKTPEWLQINPRGLVPSLLHNNKSIYESSILLEYLDEAFPAENGPTIFPQGDAYKRFQARVWADYVSKKLVPPYYKMLQTKSKEGKDEAAKLIIDGLKYMFDEKPYEGRYFLGDQPGFVDFMFCPFAYRFSLVLKHFYDFSVPNEGYEKYHAWLDNVMQLECVKKTLADETKLIASYERYANDTAQTLVAEAIRKGTAFP